MREDKLRLLRAVRFAAVLGFGESADAVRLLCIGLIVAGIAGLKVVTP